MRLQHWVPIDRGGARPTSRTPALAGMVLFAALVAAACNQSKEPQSASPSTTATSPSTSVTTREGPTDSSAPPPTSAMGAGQGKTVGETRPAPRPPGPGKGTGQSASGPHVNAAQSSPSYAAAAPSRGVGTVKKVVNPAARVNDAEASAGNPIAAAAVMTTNESGVIQFQLHDNKFDRCQLSQRSSVQVTPSDDVIMRLFDGRLLCGTNNKPGKRKIEGKNSEFRVHDPVFAIDATKRQVQVVRGFVEARSATAGAVGRLVGPRATYTVPEGRGPGPAMTFHAEELQPVERAAADEMVAALPRPDFALPPSQGSRALARMANKEPLRVGVSDSETEANQTFIEKFCGFVAGQWGVSLEVKVQKSIVIGDAVHEKDDDDLGEDIDLAVSTGSSTGATAIPFFNDGAERPWSLLVDQPDHRFADAITRFLIGALDVGEYGDRYVEAFGRQPTYEAVRPLIFP